MCQKINLGVEDRANQLIKDLDIQDKSKNMPNQLSGGEQQKGCYSKVPNQFPRYNFRR